MIEEQYEYDTMFGYGCGFNFVTRHIDGSTNETLYAYDAFGNRTQAQHRVASVIKDFEYNPYGQLTAQIQQDNGNNYRRRDEFTYYNSGPQNGYLYETVVDANTLMLTTTYEYDEVGNVTNQVDARGHNSHRYINELDQVVREISREVTDGTGLRYQKDFYYDANNNLIREEVQNIDDQGILQANTHFMTTYEYEVLNFLTNTIEEIEAGLTLSTHYEYDGSRNLTRTRYGESVNGNQPNNRVRTVYDERDMVFQIIRAEGDPDQATIQQDYDKNGNQTQILNGLEGAPHITAHVYDGCNRCVSITNAMGTATTYQYDENGNVLSEQIDGELNDITGGLSNVRLSETVYIYDNLDRRIRTETEFFDLATQLAIGDGKSISATEYSDFSQVIRTINDNGN
ncbi:MAG: hypothetical protein GKR87_03805 [Kiritimatiellae bacterium]|nr:hypothetical protein [Kiritimatiellia bacterium]